MHLLSSFTLLLSAVAALDLKRQDAVTSTTTSSVKITSSSSTRTRPVTSSTSSRAPTSVTTLKAAATITVTSTYQKIEGFGFSEAFGSASSIQSTSSSNQKKIFDYLFSAETGAGLTIIRNGIGSSAA